MQGFPWFVYILVPAVLGLLVFQRIKLHGALAANSDKTFGAVAGRLGLQVVSGDPKVNLLYFQQPARDYQRSLIAEGRPYGRPTRFTVQDSQKTSEYLVAKKITQSFGCSLQVETPIQLPAFELCLREPNQYLVPDLTFAERPDLVSVGHADPELNRLFVIRAVDPNLIPILTSALKLLSTLPTVHLAGEGSRIWITIPRIGLGSFATSPEEYLLALETAGCSIEGRPQPARLGPAAPPAPSAHAAA